MRGALSSPEALAILALGFSGMALELVLLLLFQIACGALYWRLGLLLSAFMAGLALGGGLASLKALSPARARQGLALLLSALAGLELWLCFRLPAFAALSVSTALVVFPAVLGLGGFIVGLAFPLACGSDAALVYAADLWGSAFGAFLTAAFLIPLAGMRVSLYIAAAAALAAFPRLFLRPAA
jgi:hypothetical protein